MKKYAIIANMGVTLVAIMEKLEDMGFEISSGTTPKDRVVLINYLNDGEVSSCTSAYFMNDASSKSFKDFELLNPVSFMNGKYDNELQALSVWNKIPKGYKKVSDLDRCNHLIPDCALSASKLQSSKKFSTIYNYCWKSVVTFDGLRDQVTFIVPDDYKFPKTITAKDAEALLKKFGVIVKITD